MGIFRQFPYSNFHDMNMDEIIKIVKHMLEEWAQYYAEWDAWMAEINDDWSNYQEVMNTAWQNMQNFINNYFDNLDVQNEINNKIASMVQSGEFASIVAPYIPARVSAWLTENITEPEGVVIDTSLTVAGACADAEATGDAIDKVKLFIDNFISQMAYDEESMEYEQVADVTKHDGYIWSTTSEHMSAELVAQTNRMAVEFPAKPKTPYLIQGMYAGVAQNYGIGFFPTDTGTGHQVGVFSTDVLYDATQESYEGMNWCTLFVTPDDCHYIRYNVYPNANYDKQLKGSEFHIYELKESEIPATIQRTSDNNLLTSNKTIVGAINEIYSGGGGGGDESPWTLYPDNRDMTSDILSRLNVYGICHLMNGTFTVHNLVMPNNSILTGNGASSIIELDGTDSTAGYAIKMGSHCTVSNLKIVGGTTETTMAATLINRHGILWEGTYDIDQNAPKTGTIENVFIEHFKGGGITCRNTGTPINNCIKVTNAFINHCRAGINIAYSSEFNLFTNVQCYGCYYGVVNNGGNNMFINCNFSSNTIGFIMASIDSGITLTNVQHGSAVGCLINHSHANTGIGIKIDGGSSGFIFSGCQLFYSAIDIANTSGILFDALNIGDIAIAINNCLGAVMFSNSMFNSQPTVTKNNSPNIITSKCYNKNTGASITI